MRILLLGIITLLCTSFNGVSLTEKSVIPTAKTVGNLEYLELYHDFGLTETLQFEAFRQAMQGREKIKAKNKNIITIIDFTLPSTEKRMVVLDLERKQVLFHTIVSHGRNSGEKYATSFSNKHGSYQSSLGFYLTENTYFGGNGYSLRLDGLEKGINDQAKARAVVIHGADYCSEAIIKSTGRLGRSYGCPALPREINEEVINTIKNGTLLYIYADNQEYVANSKYINSQNQYLEPV
ncbi:MAG: murein L,D-transpeptidase catalytic domain family protein [Flavobacteriaceae bacterium]